MLLYIIILYLHDGFKLVPLMIDISVNIFKSTTNIVFPFITNIKNLSIEEGCFPVELIAKVRPISKKKMT